MKEPKTTNVIQENPDIINREEAKAIKFPMEVAKKRTCEKLDELLNALNDDLYAYYYWEDEETSSSAKLSIY